MSDEAVAGSIFGQTAAQCVFPSSRHFSIFKPRVVNKCHFSRDNDDEDVIFDTTHEA
jgi:hypothetical protein